MGFDEKVTELPLDKASINKFKEEKGYHPCKFMLDPDFYSLPAGRTLTEKVSLAGISIPTSKLKLYLEGSNNICPCLHPEVDYKESTCNNECPYYEILKAPFHLNFNLNALFVSGKSVTDAEDFGAQEVTFFPSDVLPIPVSLFYRLTTPKDK